MAASPGMIARLMGIAGWRAPSGSGVGLDNPAVEQLAEMRGGQISPVPLTQTRWYLDELEAAQVNADRGDLTQAARLMRACRADGIISGLISTRTNGLVRLPKVYRGDPEQVGLLQLGSSSVRSVFEEMCPPGELAALAADGAFLGVGVGELLEVPGRSFPVLCRLDPEFLYYQWSNGRWYYRSIAGLLEVTPGDGRWVLHIQGGRIAPWNSGAWRAVGKAWIRKEHAALHKDNWEAKLANPARVAVSPNGSTEAQKESWFRRVMAWGVNTVFGLTPGYDVKLLESNGRGHEAWESTIERSEREAIVALAGQVVTTDGGAGFSNANVHESIRADLIQADADALAYTLNTQVIPPWVLNHFGEQGLENCACVAWDTTPPREHMSDAQALATLGGAFKALGESLAPYGKRPNVDLLAAKFGLPVELISETANPASDPNWPEIEYDYKEAAE